MSLLAGGYIVAKTREDIGRRFMVRQKMLFAHSPGKETLTPTEIQWCLGMTERLASIPNEA